MKKTSYFVVVITLAVAPLVYVSAARLSDKAIDQKIQHLKKKRETKAAQITKESKNPEIRDKRLAELDKLNGAAVSDLEHAKTIKDEKAQKDYLKTRGKERHDELVTFDKGINQRRAELGLTKKKVKS